MGVDEEGTLRRLNGHRRQLIDPKISEHRGRIVKTTGDGMLVEFPSVVNAVRCAAEIQRAMVDRNSKKKATAASAARRCQPSLSAWALPVRRSEIPLTTTARHPDWICAASRKPRPSLRPEVGERSDGNRGGPSIARTDFGDRNRPRTELADLEPPFPQQAHRHSAA
jgi:hypothetical protein